MANLAKVICIRCHSTMEETVCRVCLGIAVDATQALAVGHPVRRRLREIEQLLLEGFE